MRELNALIYTTIKNDPLFIQATGASAKDPRIYKSRTPAKTKVTDILPSFVVYYKSGSIHYSPEMKVFGAARNDYVYVLEVYGKKDINVETVAFRLERLFDEKVFTTTTYRIGYTYATRGTISFDESRQLYTENLTVYFTKILTLNEAS